jgi:CRISPR-associated protein Csm2
MAQVKISTTREEITKIIATDSPQLLVAQAEHIGEQLARPLSKSQIRNIFGRVRQIQLNWREEGDRARAYRDLQLLRPKMAYQAARERDVRPLAGVLDHAIQEVGDSRVRFQRFVDFFEAILAYHTKYGGQ